jgi:hypothetical protein
VNDTAVEKLKDIKHETPKGPEIVVKEFIPPVSPVADKLDIVDDGTLAAQELESDGALDEVYGALQKLGISDKAISLALGIDPPAIRKGRRDARNLPAKGTKVTKAAKV